MRNREDIRALRASVAANWHMTGQALDDSYILGVLDWVLDESVGELQQDLELCCKYGHVHKDTKQSAEILQEFRTQYKLAEKQAAEVPADTKAQAPAASITLSRADLEAVRATWVKAYHQSKQSGDLIGGMAASGFLTLTEALLGENDAARAMVDRMTQEGRTTLEKERETIELALHAHRVASNKAAAIMAGASR